MNVFNPIKLYLLRLHWFDAISVLGLIIVLVAGFVFFFRKNEYITVTLRVTQDSVFWYGSQPRTEFVYLFRKGMRENDSIGRVNAEVQDVLFYPTSEESKQVFLTLRLKTIYDKRANQHKYKGQSVLIGKPLKLELDQLAVEGQVADIEGINSEKQTVTLIAKAQLFGGKDSYPETGGLLPHIVKVIHEGDQVKDSKGNVVAEIISKKEEIAERLTVDQFGQIHMLPDPIRKEVYLTLRLKVDKIANEYWYMTGIRVFIDRSIPLQFATYSIYPTITSMEEMK